VVIYRDGLRDLHGASGNSSLVGNDSVIYQPCYNDMTISRNSKSLVTEKPLLKCEEDILKTVAKRVP
jgi:hypothetical protein